MRFCIQRVKCASVRVAGELVGSIGPGLVILMGVEKGDTTADVECLVEKIVNLRIFSDENGKMNRSLLDTGGAVLLISQFTLMADCRRGRRPDFLQAAPPEIALPLFEKAADAIEKKSVPVAKGTFGAHMEVALVNDGPVTILLAAKDGEIC
ncbi:MAG TPA: D-tyrosyl-tRNA(Tyr) deacylase [Firmicutes bacterium]|nr:D-tyrosyl-tRNA(Tyr) deacylase [Bacillota bacterium]